MYELGEEIFYYLTLYNEKYLMPAMPEGAAEGVLRGMYRTALQPAYRIASGVTLNPFRDVPREAVVERTVTIALEDLRSWLRNASYRVRLAVAIAALAPKLRLANVLALTWQEHVDPDLRFITVHRHKTVGTLRRPQVVPISEQLRLILKDARQRTDTYVVDPLFAEWLRRASPLADRSATADASEEAPDHD